MASLAESLVSDTDFETDDEHRNVFLTEKGIKRMESGLGCFGPGIMAELERRATLFHLDRLWSHHLAWIQDTRDSIHLVNLGGREPIDEFRKWSTEEFLRMQDAIDEAVVSERSAIIQKNGSVDLDLERLRGPSSTWTYLVSENPFGWGIELAKGKNIGFVKLAFSGSIGVLFTGPLLLLMLFLGHFYRSKRKS
jgi:preprotein translocase subunit SecA